EEGIRYRNVTRVQTCALPILIKTVLVNILEIVIGLSGGLAVGVGYVAFLTVLGIIPRLIQLTKSGRFIKIYIACVIIGSLFGVHLSFTNTTWDQSNGLLFVWGFFHGIFVGMLAAALAEVLNVFPILAKRIGVEGKLMWLLMALMFGKIIGSLFQWLIFVQ